jgi:hypothetical protein
MRVLGIRTTAAAMVAIVAVGLTSCVPPYPPPPPIPSLSRASVNTGGGDTDGASSEAAISANGRYVAFTSEADNIVAADTNHVRDVFVRDLQTNTTSRVSVATGGTQGNGPSYSPAISGDGRYVTFVSDATNLVAGDTNATSDVFVRDTVANTTTRVSVQSGGGQFTSPSTEPDISADGAIVAFVNTPSTQYQETSKAQLYVRNRNAGTTTLEVEPDDGNHCSSTPVRKLNDPTVSADGRFVAYDAACTDGIDQFDRIVELDRTHNTFTLVFTNTNSDAEHFPATFANVRYSPDANALAWTTNIPGHGCCPEVDKVTVHERTARYGSGDITASGFVMQSDRPSFSNDGRYITFIANTGTDLDPSTNDALVLDRKTGSLQDASASTATSDGSGNVSSVSIDYAASRVVFTSDAYDEVNGDGNSLADAFVRSLATASAAPTPNSATINVSGGLGAVTRPPNGQSATVQFDAAFKNVNMSLVAWHTVDGSAKAGTDYVGVTNGLSNVKNGFATMTITLLGNNIESSTDFHIVITNAPAGTFITGNRTITIGYSTNYPAISADTISTPEGPGTSHVVNETLRVTPAPTHTVSAYYTTADWGALAGQDYDATSGVVVFAPGQTTKTVQITILNDSLNEANEPFLVEFSDIHGAVLAFDGIGEVTIIDND